MKRQEKTQTPFGSQKIAILGGGNLGSSLTRGFLESGMIRPDQIVATRKRLEKLPELASLGCRTATSNRRAVEECDIILVTVRPRQAQQVFREFADLLDPERHLVISTVTALSIAEIRRALNGFRAIARAMPNTAVAVRESMTCLAMPDLTEPQREVVRQLFRLVGEVIEIGEEYMTPATALCACGLAFFLRAVRAASQGGIEIGFHGEEALKMAAQTAKGAATLLLRSGNHPEWEIDRVTTPRGCTISGLNEMEHHGFSSALIKGIVVSAKKADLLLENNHS